MPYATTSYTFKESKRNGSITIDCCKKCPTCRCLNCSVESRFKVVTTRLTTGSTTSDICCNYVTISIADVTYTGHTSYAYKLTNIYGMYSLLFPNIIIEYTFTCNSITIWVYYDSALVTYNEYIKVYYYDDEGVWQLLYEGLSEGA